MSEHVYLIECAAVFFVGDTGANATGEARRCGLDHAFGAPCCSLRGFQGFHFANQKYTRLRLAGMALARLIDCTRLEVGRLRGSRIPHGGYASSLSLKTAEIHRKTRTCRRVRASQPADFVHGSTRDGVQQDLALGDAKAEAFAVRAVRFAAKVRCGSTRLSAELGRQGLQPDGAPLQNHVHSTRK